MGETRLIALGQQLETETRYPLKPLVGLDAGQPKGRAAFEGEQVTGMAKQLRDDLISLGLWHGEGVPRGGALGGWRRGLFERTWHQARHR